MSRQDITRLLYIKTFTTKFSLAAGCTSQSARRQILFDKKINYLHNETNCYCRQSRFNIQRLVVFAQKHQFRPSSYKSSQQKRVVAYAASTTY